MTELKKWSQEYHVKKQGRFRKSIRVGTKFKLNKMKIIQNISLTILLFFSSCSSNTSTITNVSDLSTLLTTHIFFQESSLNESFTYSFNGSSFILTLKDKRSGASRTFDGSYEVKSAKYSDNGNDFFYVKLIFNDNNYADKLFFVYHDGNLVEPESNGIADVNEDQYGLNIPEWHVTLAPNYNSYTQTSK